MSATRSVRQWPAWVDDVLAYAPLAELEPEWQVAVGDAVVRVLDQRAGMLAPPTCDRCGSLLTPTKRGSPRPVMAHYVVKDEGDGALAYWGFDTAEQAHAHPFARDEAAVVIAIPSAAAAPPPADTEETA